MSRADAVRRIEELLGSDGHRLLAEAVVDALGGPQHVGEVDHMEEREWLALLDEAAEALEVIDADSGDCLGQPSSALAAASADAIASADAAPGYVMAYYERGYWQHCPAQRVEDYRRMGHELRSVYVEVMS